MKDTAIERLKNYLEEKRYTDDQFGKLIGTSKATVNRWWHGTSPSMKHLVEIFKNFPDITPNYLFNGLSDISDKKAQEYNKVVYSYEYVENLRAEHLEEVRFLRSQVEFLKNQIVKNEL